MTLAKKSTSSIPSPSRDEGPSPEDATAPAVAGHVAGPMADAAVEHEADDIADLGPQEELRSMQVDIAEHGERLDKLLALRFGEFSRSYLQQLVEDGAVTLQSRVVRKSATRLKAGELLTLQLRPTPQSRAFTPQAMPLNVVYEDAHMLVIDKPAGLVVHPAPGNWSGTLLNGLLAWDARLADVPRAGIVHRLDKDTSGLMMVARTRAAMDVLVQRIAERSVQRIYLALAHRPWQGPLLREVDAPLGRDPANRLRMAVVDTQRHAGKPARTSIEVLAQAEEGCLVRCTLHTGRTHQIRVHMASLRHPLVADSVYGGAPAAGLVRQALHAHHLALAHPVTDAPLHFDSALPEDMQAALAQWGLRYNPPH
jgi:23S rRNA pseudouridine1911/1915/1917 synthase